MSVTDITFDRWELAVADDVYIRNRSGSSIGVQTFKMQWIVGILHWKQQ